MKYKNVIYQSKFNAIGGTESFVYNLVKKYSATHDLAVFYYRGAEAQLNRIRQYAPVIPYSGQDIECDVLITGADNSIINTTQAKRIIHVVHADYKLQGLDPKQHMHPRITEYVAVSEAAAKGWTELTGVPCKVIPNPLAIDKPKRVLRLISATRLTPEKGRHRIETLAQMLTDAGLPFQWLVFTNDTGGFKSPNIINVPPRLDLEPYIASADYLVQLSDSEACCYSVNEALTLGTPVIVTDIPSFREQGVEDGKTGYLLPLDMQGVNVKQLYNKIPRFDFEPREDTWGDELQTGKSEYTKALKERYLVEATDAYQRLNTRDAILGRVLEPGEQFTVDGIRLGVLLGDNRHGCAMVKKIRKLK
jgi:glycosyltransferase involved in cell wall biosynthesis